MQPGHEQLVAGRLGNEENAMARLEHPTSVHNPGTPDDDLQPERLQGRLAYRAKMRPEAPFSIKDRIAWYDGWFDEPLGMFYGRPSPSGREHWLEHCRANHPRKRKEQEDE